LREFGSKDLEFGIANEFQIQNSKFLIVHSNN
jgi:hypothetical protein